MPPVVWEVLLQVIHVPVSQVVGLGKRLWGCKTQWVYGYFRYGFWHRSANITRLKWDWLRDEPQPKHASLTWVMLTAHRHKFTLLHYWFLKCTRNSTVLVGSIKWMNAVCLCSLLPVPENELKYSIPQRPLMTSKGKFPFERCTDCFIQTFYYFTPGYQYNHLLI